MHNAYNAIVYSYWKQHFCLLYKVGDIILFHSILYHAHDVIKYFAFNSKLNDGMNTISKNSLLFSDLMSFIPLFCDDHSAEAIQITVFSCLCFLFFYWHGLLACFINRRKKSHIIFKCLMYFILYEMSVNQNERWHNLFYIAPFWCYFVCVWHVATGYLKPTIIIRLILTTM